MQVVTEETRVAMAYKCLSRQCAERLQEVFCKSSMACLLIQCIEQNAVLVLHPAG
jgi:hypothetical protein